MIEPVRGTGEYLHVALDLLIEILGSLNTALHTNARERHAHLAAEQ